MAFFDRKSWLIGLLDRQNPYVDYKYLYYFDKGHYEQGDDYQKGLKYYKERNQWSPGAIGDYLQKTYHMRYYVKVVEEDYTEDFKYLFELSRAFNQTPGNEITVVRQKTSTIALQKKLLNVLRFLRKLKLIHHFVLVGKRYCYPAILPCDFLIIIDESGFAVEHALSEGLLEYNKVRSYEDLRVRERPEKYSKRKYPYDDLRVVLHMYPIRMLEKPFLAVWGRKHITVLSTDAKSTKYLTLPICQSGSWLHATDYDYQFGYYSVDINLYPRVGQYNDENTLSELCDYIVQNHTMKTFVNLHLVGESHVHFPQVEIGYSEEILVILPKLYRINFIRGYTLGERCIRVYLIYKFPEGQPYIRNMRVCYIPVLSPHLEIRVSRFVVMISAKTGSYSAFDIFYHSCGDFNHMDHTIAFSFDGLQKWQTHPTALPISVDSHNGHVLPFIPYPEGVL